MGFLKLLRNSKNSDGIREAVKIIYKKASNHTMLQDVSEEYHQKGLYAALATRYMAIGMPLNEMALAIELSLFFMIDSQSIALDALSEYVIYKEKPIDAKVEGLKLIFNNAIIKNRKENLDKLVYVGLISNCLWSDLLDSQTKHLVEQRNYGL